MVFTSASFLFIFLPVVLLLFHILPSRFRMHVFLIASFIFYGFWRLDFVLLLVFSTLVDFYCGQKIYFAKEQVRKLFLAISITTNLSLLGYFKYFNFGVDSLNLILEKYDFVPLHFAQVILPVGISFFTFQTMSYSIDLYRKVIKPAPTLTLFATYVAMFPQLVAGPIVRYQQIEKEILRIGRNSFNFNLGFHFFALGFCKKILIANNLSPLVDEIFLMNGQDTITAFFGAVAYAFQIYFDFSGYSDMAIGLGYWFGFKFPVNFNSPYKAISITDFWRRWHITLSSWFRDYLYIPLGGNRKGTFRTYFNLFAVMLLCGFWHGANWTFLIWGLGHGLLLMFERVFSKEAEKKSHFRRLKNLKLFLIVCLLWIPFRVIDVEHLFSYLNSFLVFKSISTSYLFIIHESYQLWVLLLAIMVSFFCRNTQEVQNLLSNKYQAVKFILFFFAIHEMLGQAYNPFLYFNF